MLESAKVRVIVDADVFCDVILYPLRIFPE
jgi:hypothetical protein